MSNDDEFMSGGRRYRWPNRWWRRAWRWVVKCWRDDQPWIGFAAISGGVGMFLLIVKGCGWWQ